MIPQPVFPHHSVQQRRSAADKKRPSEVTPTPEPSGDAAQPRQRGHGTCRPPSVMATTSRRTRRKRAPEPPIDPVESARAAGLRHVSDQRPGLRRERRDKGFVYLDLNGRPIRDEPTLRRIKALAIPPAWTDVWIA